MNSVYCNTVFEAVDRIITKFREIHSTLEREDVVVVNYNFDERVMSNGTELDFLIDIITKYCKILTAVDEVVKDDFKNDKLLESILSNSIDNYNISIGISDIKASIEHFKLCRIEPIKDLDTYKKARFFIKILLDKMEEANKVFKVTENKLNSMGNIDSIRLEKQLEKTTLNLLVDRTELKMQEVENYSKEAASKINNKIYEKKKAIEGVTLEICKILESYVARVSQWLN